ncbi:hypothetical protein [Leptolyngbya sp. PCC 6406]|uniref:hypothetical protein n=1 Tax=Leptolyngbya sp. PCC 6406 TaxID=1173264 RepID=UPI0002ABEF25|nr:hypothetical protein [Leptolyngbya sp. PCC 6406]
MSEIKVGFVPVESDPPHTSDIPLTVKVECIDQQSSSTQCLDFRLKVTNESDTSIQLSNPYESVSYQMTDGEGWPVTIGAPPRAAKINGPRRTPATKAKYLAVTNVDLDEESITVEEALTASKFDLHSGSTLILGLRIGYMLRNTQSNMPIPLAAGEYHVTMLFPMSWVADGKKDAVLLRSTDAFTITLLSV